MVTHFGHDSKHTSSCKFEKAGYRCCPNRDINPNLLTIAIIVHDDVRVLVVSKTVIMRFDMNWMRRKELL